MTAMLEAINAANRQIHKRLDILRKQLESGSSQRDLDVVRRELADWIDATRYDTLQQSTAVNDAIVKLIRECRERIDCGIPLDVGPENLPTGVDPLTGLPGRPQAEVKLTSLVKQPSSYAAIFHLDRLRSVHDRYGTRGTDALVLQFSQYLAQALVEPDCLFRWTEAAFLGMVPENSSVPQAIRVQNLRQEAITRHFCNLDFDGRVALLPITCRFKLWSTAGAAVERVIKDIDSFLSATGPTWVASGAAGR